MRETKLEDWMLAIAASMWVGWLWFDFTPKSWPPILGFLVVTPVVVLVALWLARTRARKESMHGAVNRTERQKQIYLWAKETFGHENIRPDERARRFLEEALELAQAQGLGVDDVQKLAARVFSKPAGDAPQEVGGVGLTLLAYAESIGISADVEERIELARVLNIQKEVFRERHNKKADAGVAVRAPE